MRFIVDKCTGPAVAAWLRGQKHEVFSVYDQARDMDDDDIIRKAFTKRSVLVINDKDFGEKIYRQRYPHHGVVLLRLEDERAIIKIRTLQRLIANYAGRLTEQYVVVTETSVRFAGR
jgi:predicted nuclease of predicted toxin-antitoxin system